VRSLPPKQASIVARYSTGEIAPVPSPRWQAEPSGKVRRCCGSVCAHRPVFPCSFRQGKLVLELLALADLWLLPSASQSRRIKP
jgi:hypothetical protein